MLVFAFNVALLIVPIVSSALSPVEAVKWAAILNGVAVVSRTGLKIVALATGSGALQPGPDATPAPVAAAGGVHPAPPASKRARGPSSSEAVSGAAAAGGRRLPTAIELDTFLVDVEMLVSDAEEFANPPSMVARREHGVD